MRFVSFLAALTLFGCSDGSPNEGDAAADAPPDVVDAAPFAPAAHGAFPQEVNLESDGGVVTAMTVVPIFFANDGLQSGIEGLYAELPSSPYWSALEKEYGVGPLTVAPSIVLSDAPPASATSLQTEQFINGKLASDKSWPAPTEGTLYFIYYPSTTTLSFSTETSCTNFLGYHSYGQTPSASRYLFAVQARCSGGALSLVDDATQNTTHELVEAATDPFLVSYATQDSAHLAWSLYPGFEIGDLCELETLTYARMVGKNMIARFWSNSSAAAGHDPCAPSIGSPYFNSVPVLTDPITVTINGQTMATTGATIATGTTRTIDVQLFSDAPTSAWTLLATDALDTTGTSPGELQFVWDKASGNNGDTRKLTIRRAKDGANGGSEFMIYSVQSQAVWHAYFGWIGN